MPIKPSIFIAAPHSHCEAKARDCDTVAKVAVDALLVADRDHATIRPPHMADRLRSRGDYNRPVSDDSAWREELRRRIVAEKPAIVLEIHSFPGEYPTFRDAWHGADLVLFESAANRPWVGALAEAVRANAPGKKIITASPWHPVSISDDCSQLGVPHVLVEFNEDADRTLAAQLAPALLQAVARVARGWPAGGASSRSQKERTAGAGVVLALLVLCVLVVIAVSTGITPRWPIGRPRWCRIGP